MNRPGTAREALIAEALGELGQLLDRLETLAPSMEHSRKALTQSTDRLEAQIVSYEYRMNAVNDKVKTHVINNLAARLNEQARQAQVEQTRSMQEAARWIFGKEIVPVLQRLISPLEPLAHKINHPWENWLTHAATAAVASTLTLGLMTYVFATAPPADGQAPTASGCSGCCGDSVRALRLR